MDQQHAQAEANPPPAAGPGGSRSAPTPAATSPLAVVGFDLHGNVHLWSPAAERLFGWSGSEVLGGTAPFIPAGREQECATFVENVARGGAWAAESQGLRRDGSLLDVRIAATPIEGEGHLTQVLVMYEDISERRRGEQVQASLAARMQALLDAAPLGAYLVDSDFRIAAVNRTAAPVFGDIPELIGRSFDEVIRILWPDAYANEVVGRFRHTLQTGEEYIVDERAEVRRDTGVVEYYEWRIDRITLPGGQHAVVSYFKDISDRVRRREQFQRLSVESERQRRLYDTILSHTPDLVYVFDLEHRFTYANNALLRCGARRGRSRSAGPAWSWATSPGMRRMHDREIEQVIATRRPIRGEVPFNGAEGRRIYDYIFVPIFGPNGDVEAIAGTTRDVTDRVIARGVAAAQRAAAGQVFDAAPAFMAVVRGPEMVFEKANQAYRARGDRSRVRSDEPLLEALPELADTPFPGSAPVMEQRSRPIMAECPGAAAPHGRRAPSKNAGSTSSTSRCARRMERFSGVRAWRRPDRTHHCRARIARSEQRLRFVIDSMPQKIFTATPRGGRLLQSGLDRVHWPLHRNNPGLDSCSCIPRTSCRGQPGMWNTRWRAASRSSSNSASGVQMANTGGTSAAPRR